MPKGTYKRIKRWKIKDTSKMNKDKIGKPAWNNKISK